MKTGTDEDVVVLFMTVVSRFIGCERECKSEQNPERKQKKHCMKWENEKQRRQK
jgi:hypothetical protein